MRLQTLKFIISLSIFMAMGLFQNCDSLDGFNTEFSTDEDIHAGCPQGRLPNGDCIYITPEDETRECIIENGNGLQVRVGEDAWGDCTVQTCNEGYQKLGKICQFTPIVRACTVANGIGEETNKGRGFEACKVTSCSTGYHADNNSCAFTPITKSCVITNGIGRQINTGNGFNICEVVSCNAGYNILENSCVFAKITKNCVIANGLGTQTNSGSGFNACQVKSCNTGYTVKNNACVFQKVLQNCPITNGVGLKENIGNGFGTCQVQSCKNGFKIQTNSCIFIPVTRACAITKGVGTQTDTGAGFSACRVQSCSAGYRILNNTCSFIPVTRECNVTDGSGSQTNVGSGFGACKATRCNSGFRVQGNTCISNHRACTILNGVGDQVYDLNTKLWGSCKIKSCNSTYVANTIVGFCVKANAPKAKVNIHVIRMNDGTGNNLWTNDYIDRVFVKLNLLLKGNIVFILNSRKDIKDTELYDLHTLKSFGGKLVELRKFTEITVAISNPVTSDAYGKALNVKYNYEPFLAMRSYYKDGSERDVNHVAQILLHELGHNMGMTHDYGGEVNMDNRYIYKPEIYVKYINGLNACTTSLCHEQYAKLSTYSPNQGGSDR